MDYKRLELAQVIFGEILDRRAAMITC